MIYDNLIIHKACRSIHRQTQTLVLYRIVLRCRASVVEGYNDYANSLVDEIFSNHKIFSIHVCIIKVLRLRNGLRTFFEVFLNFSLLSLSKFCYFNVENIWSGSLHNVNQFLSLNTFGRHNTKAHIPCKTINLKFLLFFEFFSHFYVKSSKHEKRLQKVNTSVQGETPSFLLAASYQARTIHGSIKLHNTLLLTWIMLFHPFIWIRDSLPSSVTESFQSANKCDDIGGVMSDLWITLFFIFLTTLGFNPIQAVSCSFNDSRNKKRSASLLR